MMKEDFPFIILMCTESVMWKRWMRLAMKIIFTERGVSLIEWANLIEEILPEHYTEIKIEKDLEKGFDYRRITICEY